MHAVGFLFWDYAYVIWIHDGDPRGVKRAHKVTQDFFTRKSDSGKYSKLSPFLNKIYEISKIIFIKLNEMSREIYDTRLKRNPSSTNTL